MAPCRSTHTHTGVPAAVRAGCLLSCTARDATQGAVERCCGASGLLLTQPCNPTRSQSLVAVQVPHAELWSRVSAFARANAPRGRMDDHALSVTAWGLSKAGPHDPATWAALAAACGRRAGAMAGLDLLHAARAFATVPRAAVEQQEVSAFLEAAARRCVAAAAAPGAAAAEGAASGGGGAADAGDGASVRALLPSIVAALVRASQQHGLGPDSVESLAAARQAAAALQPAHKSGALQAEHGQHLQPLQLEPQLVVGHA